jgi:hypothetical protein
MDTTLDQRITCCHCGEVFGSKGKYGYHYSKIHQNKVKNRYSEDGELFTTRSEREKFGCVCEKEYLTYGSLCRHQKGCGVWKGRECIGQVNSDSYEHERGNSWNKRMLIFSQYV